MRRRFRTRADLAEHRRRPGEVFHRYGAQGGIEFCVAKRQHRIVVEIVDHAMSKARIAFQFFAIHAQSRYP
ncbi:MAG: hypothetical protein MZW92_78860 [Comamonadaceae bacterium]|nr:hypothetical protein [Comamonadaceae bacterium]